MSDTHTRTHAHAHAHTPHTSTPAGIACCEPGGASTIARETKIALNISVDYVPGWQVDMALRELLTNLWDGAKSQVRTACRGMLCELSSSVTFTYMLSSRVRVLSTVGKSGYVSWSAAPMLTFCTLIFTWMSRSRRRTMSPWPQWNGTKRNGLSFSRTRASFCRG